MHKDEDYGLFKNLISLLMWMQGSVNGITIQDLMDKYDVSRRTAERMRNAVKEYFLLHYEEIIDGTTKKFKLRDPELEKVALASITEEELGTLKIATDLLKANNLVSQANLLESFGDKIRGSRNLSNTKSINIDDLMRLEGIAMKPAPQFLGDPKTIGMIRKAILSFHRIKINYENLQKKKSEYSLIPLGILYGERNHYLVARFPDSKKRKIKHFILDHILNIEILEDTFVEDTSFSLKKHTAGFFGSFDEKPFDVEWLFAPEAVENAKKMIFHPTQKTKLNPDGSLTVKFKAGGKVEMAWHLFTWGNTVKVIKPEDFWNSIPQVWKGFPAK